MKAEPKISLLICFAALALGCDAMNDNPISADKMQQIRKQQAAQRANFNPGGGPPPSPPAQAPKSRG